MHQDPLVETFLAKCESETITFSLFKVKWHSGVPENELVDKMAREGCKSSDVFDCIFEQRKT